MEDKRRAAIRYLQLRKYDIVEKNFDGFIVAYNTIDDYMAFVNVSMNEDFKSDQVKRSHFEKAIKSFFASHDGYIDIPVSYDEMCICVVADNRAIVKHYVNADARLED